VKEQLRELILQAIQALQGDATLPADLALPGFVIERARSREHGDFACNVAMLLAKQARAKPRDLAEKLVAALPANDLVAKVEIAGPGFINFFLAASASSRKPMPTGAVPAAARRWAWSSFRPTRPARCTWAMAAPRRSAIASAGCWKPPAGT
jgi:hypothetical protein